ncbi:Plant/F18B13-26 protein [Quillaja saponaria]|uniref:Plant/F18B13-26 protein n=1 Tax=Quillaja saponaria TaxID=32244 RepID=A0AAD7LEU8_QUISA|nr:Plant/F18B13-26 protein [Quillaja saponaria]
MAGLQRSVTSFRRQGSSGMVWDDKFIKGLAGDLNQTKSNQRDDQKEEPRPSQNKGSVGMMPRSRSAGARSYPTTVKVSPPRKDPPSPKVSGACGLCGFFGKPVVAAQHPKPKKRR